MTFDRLRPDANADDFMTLRRDGRRVTAVTVPPTYRLRRIDEDTSLVERAEERADRFVDYKDKRISDAERAHEAVFASLTISR